MPLKFHADQLTFPHEFRILADDMGKRVVFVIAQPVMLDVFGAAPGAAAEKMLRERMDHIREVCEVTYAVQPKSWQANIVIELKAKDLTAG